MTESNRGTVSTDGAIELAVLEREGFVESRHSGIALVMSADGDIIQDYGDVSADILPRSCLKPAQAIAVMTSGVMLRGEDAAIICSSHSGTKKHVSLIKNLLSRNLIPESALACPSSFPRDREAMEAMRLSGDPARSIYMTCSGKHTGMLMACAQNDWPLDGYLNEDHPVQQKIMDTVERFSGEKVRNILLDGCGAPLPILTLTALARTINRIVTANKNSPFALYREAAELTIALRENPVIVSGPNEQDAIVTARLGVISKFGAEAVQVLAAKNGTTVVVKILDGNHRASVFVALELLARSGAISQTEHSDTVDALKSLQRRAEFSEQNIRVTA